MTTKRFALERGRENARAKDQVSVRKEIMVTLSLTMEMAFMQRRRGGIEHRITEHEAIE